jgi:hypothetical protein
VEAEMVSVTLSPLAKVALAAPAQQSSSINVSDIDLSRSVWIADHLCLKSVRCTGRLTREISPLLQGWGIRLPSGAPGTLPGVVYPSMATIVDDKESIFGLVLLDHVTDLDHEFAMGVVGRNGEYFRLKIVLLSETLLQVHQLWQYPKIIADPMN